MEKQFVLRIDSPTAARVYLSTSWHPDRGLDLAYRLVRSFDQESIRMVGDAKDLRDQEEPRIRRIMADCDGMLCVFPFRPEDPRGTSPYMLAELRIAVDVGLPLAVLFDKRIPLVPTHHDAGVSLSFANGLETVEIPRDLLCGLQSYDMGVATAEALAEAAIVPLRTRVLERAQRDELPAYAFLITRLKDDFSRARHAIATAVERGTGLPCLWIDAPGYQSNVTDTVERTRLLIEHAQFVVADLSRSEENADFDNPTRAHEIGIAMAFGKKLFITAQEPRRDPYHALSVAQVLFWKDEAHLFAQLREVLHAERKDVGRHTYNWDLPRPGDQYVPRLAAPEYRADFGKPHAAPSDSQLSRTQSWVLAICFALSALAASVLLNRYAHFGDTFDFAGAVGAVFALTFSSDLSGLLRRQLARSPLLRGAILVGTAVLVVAAIFAPARGGGTGARPRPAAQAILSAGQRRVEAMGEFLPGS